MLLAQVALTRIFSITQSYHFAFLVISLALLGFGASGSLLALSPRFQGPGMWPWYAVGYGVSTVLGYALVNLYPFDSYAIAWDSTQAYLLIANLLALALPFLFAGALVGSMLTDAAGDAGRVYGANLVGSGAGAALGPVVISSVGSERAVLLCGALAAGAGLVLAAAIPTVGTTARPPADAPAGRRGPALTSASPAVLASLVALVGCLGLVLAFPPQLEAQPSPYKALSHLRRNPEARILATRQNAQARLDIVSSPTIHSAQGLSLSYAGDLPRQAGLLVDGDNLLPVPEAARAPRELARALPVAVAYAVRPEARTLLLGSGGGMEPWAALANGAREVTVVEPNELVAQALRSDLRSWAGLAGDPRVRIEQDEIRTFAQRSDARYELVELTLAMNYRPISSGAFTLTENYALTVEAFRSYLQLCGQDGLLVVTRWLQSPPSESLRTLGLIIEALGNRAPVDHVVAFRTFQTVTFLVKPRPFSAEETSALLHTIDRLRYDLVLAPRMPAGMLNRYARLPAPVDHQLSLRLATTDDRSAFYSGYDFEVSPPTDDRPFFFHFFRWEQTPAVLEELGRRWQPFGGSGYFVLLVLLAFAVTAAVTFIVAPLALRARFRQALRQAGRGRVARALGYFTAIGLAFLLVEVALIQRFILVLGQPTLTVSSVVGSLLLASGLGSSLSARLPWRAAIVALAALLAVYPWLATLLTPSLLELPLPLRVAAVALLIGPVGLLMGVPLARGVQALRGDGVLIPWAWAANGSASVVSAVLAAILSLSVGFTPVLLVGGTLYLLAAALASSGRSAPSAAPG